ncbi:MAG: sodium:solute symporter family protein, partial [Candidatus Amoebophilus sp.]
MLGLNIDMIIFGLFLIINLSIGLFSSRRVTSLRDYAVGKKDFSTATLTATIVVSWLAGMYVFEILEYTYRDGLYFIIVVSGASICLWLVGSLAVRMREFLKNISVAEAMGDLYGRTVQIIAGISGGMSVITLVAMEFKVISKVTCLIF